MRFIAHELIELRHAIQLSSRIYQSDTFEDLVDPNLNSLGYKGEYIKVGIDQVVYYTDLQG